MDGAVSTELCAAWTIISGASTTDILLLSREQGMGALPLRRLWETPLFVNPLHSTAPVTAMGADGNGKANCFCTHFPAHSPCPILSSLSPNSDQPNAALCGVMWHGCAVWQRGVMPSGTLCCDRWWCSSSDGAKGLQWCGVGDACKGDACTEAGAI